MNGLLDLPVEIILAIVDRVPPNSLFTLSLTCRLLNYLSTSALLEHCGIRDPTNCTFDIYTTVEGQADALSALQAGLHIQQMKFLRCNLRPTGYYPQWEWPAAKLIRRLHRLMLRLASIDEVVLSFNMRGMIVPHDIHLRSGVIILQELLNTVITKCKILRLMSAGSFFGNSYLFNQPDSGSSITQRLQRFVNRNDSPDWQYTRNISTGTRPFLTCPPAALQQIALSRMEIDALSLFTPPCSSWTFTVLRQSQITSLTVNLKWPTSRSTQAERSLIFSRLAEALQPSLKFLFLKGVTHLLDALSFIAQLPLLETFGVLPWTWKASIDEGSTITSFPLVLSMETISAPADLVFYMFSRPLIVPRLRIIFLAFSIKKVGGLEDITTTATSIARLRESVGPSVKLLMLFHLGSVPSLEESLCDGIRPVCPIWEQEFSRFTTLSLNGLTALLDSPDTFRVILGVLTLFSKLEELRIELRTNYETGPPIPINLKTWMVEAILDRSPNVTSISCNGTAQRIIPRQMRLAPIILRDWISHVHLGSISEHALPFPTEILRPTLALAPENDPLGLQHRWPRENRVVGCHDTSQEIAGESMIAHLPFMYMWAKLLVARRVMPVKQPVVALNGVRTLFSLNHNITMVLATRARLYERGVTTIVLLKPSHWCLADDS
ncbi:uncharacterized protein LACBIDRAFT_325819 [Laccaria bicolor S238N-H82]|uniref:Predicted protein n=1 Tax=Laccaria bicolor (strain S238N-H82 / ATCC MYA-4686) TaxID=486041 RepID=B0D6C1_LACBS|nr:uncharacterized protein LACBIDRAFT_325819 [Laccaria bicolor S238N-H82]EDR09920.1 predicted protein [Laccaria bicolor S238N-H82]|eukprot:XP_001879305.1 predicted protein [Laccaria bicolor S238N-H82]